MILSPNTSGQGHDPDHLENPYHDALIAAGFAYSHSTPVVYGSDSSVHHTYKRGQRSISVWRDPHCAGWPWTWGGAARPGSGRHYRGRDTAALNRYLRNMRARVK